MKNIEIIPNWHPVLVHFTIALLIISTMLFIFGIIFSKYNLTKKYEKLCSIAAHINLWIGSFITIFTLLAGFYAYYSVAHDGSSHNAMANHMIWALPTAFIWILLAIWSLIRVKYSWKISMFFVALLCIASICLLITGFKGEEVVYRYGIGVKSLPKVHGAGEHSSHHHHHEISS